MNCFLTGGSGFIGGNLVRELVALGHQVRVLVRRPSDVRGLAGVKCKLVEGDINEPETLRGAMRHCDWCFHAAASYHLWLPNYEPMYAANVEGTRHVLEAAVQAGCSRIVYTSTVGCIGLPKAGGGTSTITDEDTPVSEDQMNNHYKLSKWRAEQVALQYAKEGAPVVIVNPSAPVGPFDIKPTPTGKIVLDFLKRRLPAYLDTGLNWVHVRDVAWGHILAAQKGRIGERYILGNAEGNWTMKEALDVLQDITGLPAPSFRVPYVLALTAAYANEVMSKITGRPPQAPVAGVRMGRYKMFFSPAKAIRELGLPQTPPRQAFLDAVHWFRNQGYVRA